MTTESSDADTAITDAVVRHHLQAFLEQQGIDAIVRDYHENARFYTEAKIHQGRIEIGRFFTEFIKALPDGAIERFALRSLQVDGNVAYITWNVGNEIPLGTDTFVVEEGKIVSQSYAMYAAPSTRHRADHRPDNEVVDGGVGNDVKLEYPNMLDLA
jgi:predicted SnoaL-like aldol condensation-catalyzing enzyme